MGMRQRFYNNLKPLLLTKAHVFIPSFLARFFFYLAYLARFSRWVSGTKMKATFDNRSQMYEFVLAEEKLREQPLDYLEFGVREGGSMRMWLNHLPHPDSRFYGFDTFTGLPEDWGVVPAGALSTGGRVPDIKDARCSFRVGLFQETMYAFLQECPLNRRKLIALDADLYSSTLFVLTMLAPRLRAGDVLIFDELGSSRMPDHEYRAMEDFLASYPVKIKAIAAAKHYAHVAFVVESNTLCAPTAAVAVA